MRDDTPRGSQMSDKDIIRLQILAEDQAKKIEKLEERVSRLEMRNISLANTIEGWLRRGGLIK
jgi:hypothetical protein